MSSYVRRSVRVAVAQVGLLVVAVLGAGAVLSACRHANRPPPEVTIQLLTAWPILAWVPLAWFIALLRFARRPATSDRARVLAFGTGLLLLGLEFGLLGKAVLQPLLWVAVQAFPGPGSGPAMPD